MGLRFLFAVIHLIVSLPLRSNCHSARLCASELNSEAEIRFYSPSRAAAVSLFIFPYGSRNLKMY